MGIISRINESTTINITWISMQQTIQMSIYVHVYANYIRIRTWLLQTNTVRVISQA